MHAEYIPYTHIYLLDVFLPRVLNLVFLFPQASVVGGEARDDRRDVGYIEYQEREGEDIEELDGMRRKVAWQDLKERVMHSMTTVWTFFLLTSYIPAIIFMMVSVVAILLLIISHYYGGSLYVYILYTSESVDSICRDATDIPIGLNGSNSRMLLFMSVFRM